MCPIHKILYFSSDQIKSGMANACGKNGGSKGAHRVLMGHPDRKRTYLLIC